MTKMNWFTVKKLANNIWGIGEFKHREKAISYLLIGKKKALLFDTGLGIKGLKKRIDKITKLPVEVINSHSHYDHIGNNHEFNKIIYGKNKRALKIDPFDLQIIKTPGHTPDSICVYDKKNCFLLTGDTLYPGPIYLHLKESKFADYQKSLKKLLKLKIKIIYPGHNNFSMKPDKLLKIWQAVKGKILIQKIDNEISFLFPVKNLLK